MLLTFGSGCATKKHVAKVVAPIEGRLGQVEHKTAENGTAIGELETNVSKTNERLSDTDRKAIAAGEQAAKANELATRAGDQATQATGKAEMAQSTADKGLTRIGEVEKTIENLDNYSQVAVESVLFPVNRWDLTKDAMEQLDQIAGRMNGMRKFVVEVEGFTDKTGTKEYNLELSRRRAQAVVHYLTVKHQVPLRRIQLMGVGADLPAADNKTRDGRKQNRRVEVKVFALADQKAENQPAVIKTSSE